ncbi:HsdM family class I SAM-dependent methyltransferase [Aquihabitans sp. McL0605]|uniref:HsdM family class I SAM-dependent methyltransferase n=1 Tax=Aquihabitans sp. McL0605 TaxID=3415671 RepID=UPI003CEFD5B2
MATDHERSLDASGVRKGLGAYYTPADVVEGLLDLALDPVLRALEVGGPDAVATLRLIDPACGTGNFLVAAARRIVAVLEELGVDEHRAAVDAVRCVRGIEIDAATARLCRAHLREIDPSCSGRQVKRGDALLDPSLAREGTFDVVVGNPPFLSQLDASTARGVQGGAALRTRYGDAVASYTDPAALFLVLGHRLARRDGGVLAMIEPMSVLTARDASGARAAVLEGSALTDLWVLGEGVFDASVEVCAPVIVRSSVATRTLLHTGRERVPGVLVAPPKGADRSWSALLADHGGLPRRTLETSGTLGGLASATADFRDQYYGLAPHVVDQQVADDAVRPRLVTSGLIDPADLAWGRRSTRFNKATYQHPRVDLAALDPKLRHWARTRLVPKVLLATQTRVLEAVVDDHGLLVPSVPVISVVASPGDLWRVAAVLTCPAVALEAARRHLGSGRNSRSMRLRAQEVLDLPIPADLDRWDGAATLLRTAAVLRASGHPFDLAGHRAHLQTVGRLMDEAYGLVDDEELLGWWLEQLPTMAEPVAQAPGSDGP